MNMVPLIPPLPAYDISLKTSLLNCYGQFYMQSHYYHKELIPEHKTQVKWTHVPHDLQTPHYVTTCNVHWSLLWHYQLPRPSVSNTVFCPQDWLCWWYDSILISLYRTFWDTVAFLEKLNVTSYGFMFSCFQVFI